MLTDVRKTKIMASALTFLQHYHDEGDEFLDKIVTVIVKHGLSLSIWKPKSSLDNGCIHIHQINPGNSNDLWQTES